MILEGEYFLNPDNTVVMQGTVYDHSSGVKVKKHDKVDGVKQVGAQKITEQQYRQHKEQASNAMKAKEASGFAQAETLKASIKGKLNSLGLSQEELNILLR